MSFEVVVEFNLILHFDIQNVTIATHQFEEQRSLPFSLPIK
jgi:hypothetical protein